MLMYVALFTASLLDPVLKRKEASEVPTSMRQAFAGAAATSKTPRSGFDPDLEALLLAISNHRTLHKASSTDRSPQRRSLQHDRLRTRPCHASVSPLTPV